MSEQIVELDLANGSTALARVAVADGGAEKTASLAKFNFKEVGETLEGIAAAIKSSLEQVAPDNVTVELALELAVKNGRLSGLIVEGGGKGALNVTLEWKGDGG